MTFDKEKAREKFEKEQPKRKACHILRVTLTPDQNQVLVDMMKEDLQTNKTSFFVYLIMQEKKRRDEDAVRGIGRPRKDTDSPIVWYKSPDGSKTPYTKEDLEAYYAFRNMPMPDLSEIELYVPEL